MSHSSFKTDCCCITASFTVSRMNSWTLSLHWSWLCWCYRPYVWSAPSRQCPPSVNPFPAPLGLKLLWPKTKLQNVDAGYWGYPSSTILIDHGSHAVLPTTDRLQLGWLTSHQRVDPGGGEVLTPWKYVGKVRLYLSPLKMLHSFIQNCCITAFFAASRMNIWTLSFHWSCLCWRCYHPYVWSAPSRQCPPINAFDAILGLKLSMCYSLTMVQHKSLVAMKR